MSKMIIGLENSGFEFKNNVIRYCQDTGHPTTPVMYNKIYHEVLCQIFGLMDQDFETFMANIMMLPDFRTIHYLEEPINYQVVGDFRNAARAFAILIWRRLSSRGNMDLRYTYVLETSNEMYAVVGAYIDSSNL